MVKAMRRFFFAGASMLLMFASACATVSAPRAAGTAPSRHAMPGTPVDAQVDGRVTAIAAPGAPNGTITGVYAWGEGRAVVVGNDGIIARTRDRGVHWERVAQSEHPLTTLQGRADGTAIAGGEHGTIVVTRDFGASWRALPCPRVVEGRQSSVASVALNDTGRVVLVSSTPARALFVSRDLGSTWEQLVVLSERDETRVRVQEDGSFLASGVSAIPHHAPLGWVRRLTSTGELDEEQPDERVLGLTDGELVSTPGAAVRERLMLGAQAGLASAVDRRGRCAVVGPRGTLLVATGDCTTWRIYDAHVRDTLHAVALAPDGDLFAGGDHGVIVRLAASAAHVERVAAGDGAISARVARDALSLAYDSSARFEHAMADGRGVIWVFGRDAGVAWSDDGGATFSLGTTFLASRIEDAWVSSAGRAFVLVDVGSRCVLFVSLDGGTAWRVQSLPGPLRARFVAGVDDARIWVAGDGGPPLASSDGAQTFSARDDVTRRDVHALVALRSCGVAEGFWLATVDGEVLHSADGRAWVRTGRSNRAQINDIACVSGGRVALATDAGLELSSTDGTRFVTHDGFHGGLRALGGSGSMLLAAGDYQPLYVSRDGGETFERAGMQGGLVRAFTFVGSASLAVGFDLSRGPHVTPLTLP